MRLSLALAFGLALLVALLAWQGWESVLAAFGQVGWALLLLPLVFVPHVLLAAGSWRILFVPAEAPGFWSAARAIWVGLSIDMLLPMGSLGGEAAKARLVLGDETPLGGAVASVVLDKTVQAITIALWGLIGTALLWMLGAPGLIVAAAGGGSLLLALGIAGFVVTQRRGLGSLARRQAGKARSRRPGTGTRMMAWTRLISGAERLEGRLESLYRQPGKILLAIGIRVLSRVVLILELWWVALLLEVPLGFWEAFMIKSLADALRGAAFFLPGGWGLQEAAFIALGGTLGLGGDLSLALSLITRARELLVSLPGLLVWQRLESRAARAARADYTKSWY